MTAEPNRRPGVFVRAGLAEPPKPRLTVEQGLKLYLERKSVVGVARALAELEGRVDSGVRTSPQPRRLPNAVTRAANLLSTLVAFRDGAIDRDAAIAACERMVGREVPGDDAELLGLFERARWAPPGSLDRLIVEVRSMLAERTAVASVLRGHPA